MGEYIDKTQYKLLVSELGLQLGKSSTKTSDIAIYEKKKIETYILEKKFSAIPPKIIFEVDIQADLEETTAQGYVNKKTQQLLDWGVEKVIWIETESQKIMIATPNTPWIIINWTDEFDIVGDLHLNLAQLIANS